MVSQGKSKVIVALTKIDVFVSSIKKEEEQWRAWLVLVVVCINMGGGSLEMIFEGEEYRG